MKVALTWLICLGLCALAAYAIATAPDRRALTTRGERRAVAGATPCASTSIGIEC